MDAESASCSCSSSVSDACAELEGASDDRVLALQRLLDAAAAPPDFGEAPADKNQNLRFQALLFPNTKICIAKFQQLLSHGLNNPVVLDSRL